MDYFLEQTINGLSLGCMYAFIALGYTMVYGIIKLINFAHGEFFMFGGVMGYFSLLYVPVEKLPLPGPAASLVGLLVAILVAAFSTAIFAVLCERLVYKPLRGEGRVAATVSSIYALLFVVFLWNPLAKRFSSVGAGLLLAGSLWLALSYLPRYTDRHTRGAKPGGRIAALLTALGVSLALQNGGIWIFSASPRAWPAMKTFLSWEDLEGRIQRSGTGMGAAPGEGVGEGESAGYTVPGNLYRLEAGKKRFVFYEGQELTTAMLENQRSRGAGLFGDLPLSNAWKKALVFLSLLVSGLLLYFLVVHTNLGKAMRAVSYNHDAARLMGIDTNRVITFTFFIGAFLAGIGGVLWGLRYGKIDPYMGFLPGLKAFVAAVVGGIGSIPGAILGGVALGLIETLVAAYGFSAYRDAVAFVVLIVILLVKPSGFFGSFEGEKV